MATSVGNRKLSRNYELRIQKTSSGEFITIKPPFTLEVTIQRNILSSVNSANLRIYNLSEATRNEIQKDRLEVNILKLVELRAGYGDNLYTIFSGNISYAYSQRVSNNFITEIEGFDGGYAMKQAYISRTLKSGTTNKEISNHLVASMSPFDVKKGAIGEILGASTRGVSLEGNAYEKLIEITGSQVFIDNKKINILSQNEYIGDYIPVISSESGLLGTPRAEATRITFSMIFEPRLIIGQLITVKSSTQKKLLDGNKYKIVSLSHSGVFSDAVSGTMITEVGCFFGLEGYKKVR